MMRELYAPNYEERRLETLLRAEGRCENKIVDENGEVLWRCPHRLGTFKISRAHNPCFEQLLIHHPNDDPWNPGAEMIAVCASCHMILHRKPDTDGKVSARKQGYKVIGINQLLCCLAAVGFTVVPNKECRFNWSIGPFAAEAADQIDALVMALHWLTAEVRDLQRELEQQRAECRRLTDMQIRLQQAEERRQCDAVLREMRPR
jgi:hypothetical protein